MMQMLFDMGPLRGTHTHIRTHTATKTCTKTDIHYSPRFLNVLAGVYVLTSTMFYLVKMHLL